MSSPQVNIQSNPLVHSVPADPLAYSCRHSMDPIISAETGKITSVTMSIDEKLTKLTLTDN